MTNYIKRNTSKTIILILLGIIIIPTIIGCFYVVPSADDFQFMNSWASVEENQLTHIFRLVKDMYLDWQGTYFANFLFYIPVFEIFGLIGTRILITVNLAALIVSIYYLCKMLINTLHIKKANTVILFLLLMILFYIFGRNIHDEFIYWYTGICNYCVPLWMGFFCISLNISYKQSKKTWQLIISILLAFLSVGCSLDVSALICSLLLFINLYQWIVLKERDIKSSLVLIVAIMGSLINCLAPGNFARHQFFGDGNIHILSTLIGSCKRVFLIVCNELSIGVLLAMIILTFVIMYRVLKNSEFKFKYPVLITLYSLIMLVIVVFPVALGYSNFDNYPTRIIALENTAIIVYALLVSTYWAGWASNKQLLEFDNTKYCLLVLICIIPLVTNASPIINNYMTPLKQIRHIVNGDFSMIEKQQIEILNQVENSTNDDVVVKIKALDKTAWSNIKKIDMNGDYSPVAAYYGKKTITFDSDEY